MQTTREPAVTADPPVENAGMKIESQSLENRQVQLTIEVPADRIQAAMRSAARQLSKGAKIPGFRPGKVPYAVVLGRFGEETVFQEALEALGQEVYRQALDESELEPIAPGTLDEVVSRTPLVLRYMVPLAPEVELGDYHSLRLDFEAPEVADEAVNAVLEDMRQRRALIEPADRPARLGDVVVVDVNGQLSEAKPGEKAQLLKEQGISLLLDAENDWPFPGASDALVGIAAGEERTLSHTFPLDYASESLQGRSATFRFACQEVKSRLVPEWTDHMAQSMGDYEGLLDLRIKVRESLTERAQREAEAQYAQRMLERLVEQAALNYPPVLLENEQRELLDDLKSRLRAQKLDLETYLKVEGKTSEQLLDELKPRAEARLKRGLVIGKLVEAEGLKVEDEEVEQQVQSMVKSVRDRNLQELFGSASARRSVENDLLVDKAMERLARIGKGQLVESEESTKE